MQSNQRLVRTPLRRASSWLYRKAFGRSSSITPLWMPPTEARKITPPSPLADMFYAHEGRPINKWTHYLELYHVHFDRFRDTPVKMLEIGVFEGGSLELWRAIWGRKLPYSASTLIRHVLRRLPRPIKSASARRTILHSFDWSWPKWAAST